MTSAMMVTTRQLSRAVVPARTALITDASTKIGSALARNLGLTRVRTHIMVPEMTQLFQATLDKGVGRELNLVYNSRYMGDTASLGHYFSQITPNVIFHTLQPISDNALRRPFYHLTAAEKQWCRATLFNTQAIALYNTCPPSNMEAPMIRHFLIDPHSDQEFPWVRSYSDELQNLNDRVNGMAEGIVSSTLVSLGPIARDDVPECYPALRASAVAKELISVAFADETPPAQLNWRANCCLEQTTLVDSSII